MMLAPPTLDAIAADPQRASGLPAAALLMLLLRVAAVQSTLTAQLATAPLGATQAAPAQEDDQMLSPDEAAELLKQPRRWLARNAQRLPFVRRISPRRFVCSRNGIIKWLATRRV
jgi:hypothetical protein